MECCKYHKINNDYQDRHKSRGRASKPLPGTLLHRETPMKPPQLPVAEFQGSYYYTHEPPHNNQRRQYGPKELRDY